MDLSTQIPDRLRYDGKKLFQLITIQKLILRGPKTLRGRTPLVF